MGKYDSLKIENQICFPLYACSKEVIRLYKPFLDMLDLTYTQYITMMVLWEYRELNVKELGEKIYLDSGTLTPLLKKLESKGYIKRSRSKEDERNLLISITDERMSLREEALQVPEKMAGCVKLDMESAKNLYDILYKLLNNFKGN